MIITDWNKNCKKFNISDKHISFIESFSWSHFPVARLVENYSHKETDPKEYTIPCPVR